jgi:hypothetical protein
MNALIDEKRDEIAELCRRHRVKIRDFSPNTTA